jgi:hypothetical protein
MSIAYTYNSLIQAMQDYAEDTDPDFIAALPDMVSKGESRILRDLDLEIFEDWASVVISGGTREVSWPADAVTINSLFIRSPSAQTWTECPKRSFEYTIMYAPNETETGMPAFYSDLTESQFYVVPTPNQTYSAENARVRATIRPSGLTVSNQNTHLSDHYGDLLFSAVMIEAYDFLKHGQAMQEQATKYQSLLPSLGNEIKRMKKPEYKELNSKEGAND